GAARFDRAPVDGAGLGAGDRLARRRRRTGGPGEGADRAGPGRSAGHGRRTARGGPGSASDAGGHRRGSAGAGGAPADRRGGRGRSGAGGGAGALRAGGRDERDPARRGRAPVDRHRPRGRVGGVHRPRRRAGRGRGRARQRAARHGRAPGGPGRVGRVLRRGRVPGAGGGAGGMIRVCLVDDQTLVRHGIRRLLELSDEVEVVAEADDGLAALEAVERSRPDVVLLDLRMPRHDGIWTLEALREAGAEVPVLVLTTFDDDELVLRALRAGARGYLLKDVTLERLVGAVRTLAEGGTLVRPAITDRLLRSLHASGPAEGGPEGAPPA